MNKPAWIAWDELTRKGECIRCGTALFAGEDERADDALTRHVVDHGGCAEDEADRQRVIKDRNDIRERLTRLRLVDSSGGLMLRTPIDAATSSALVTDEAIAKSTDPQVRAAYGRVLVALSELNDAAKRTGWNVQRIVSRAPYTPQSMSSSLPNHRHGAFSIVRTAWTPAMGLVELKLPESLSPADANVSVQLDGDRCLLHIHKAAPLSPAAQEAFDAYNAHASGFKAGYGHGHNLERTGEGEYTIQTPAVPVAQSVDDYIKLRRFEMEKEERRFELQRAAAHAEQSLKATMSLAEKRQRVVLSRGNCMHHLNGNRIELVPSESRPGAWRICDVLMSGIHDDMQVTIQYMMDRLYCGSYGAIRKYGASVVEREIRIIGGVSITFDFDIGDHAQFLCKPSVEVCLEKTRERWEDVSSGLNL